MSFLSKGLCKKSFFALGQGPCHGLTAGLTIIGGLFILFYRGEDRTGTLPCMVSQLASLSLVVSLYSFTGVRIGQRPCHGLTAGLTITGGLFILFYRGEDRTRTLPWPHSLPRYHERPLYYTFLQG